MAVLVVSDCSPIQNIGSYDDLYTGTNVIRILESNPDYPLDDPAEAGGVGNLNADNSSTIITFGGLTGNIPANSLINSATLYFFAGAGFGSFDVSAWHIQRNFTPAQVTWNSYATSSPWTTAGATGAGDSISPTGASTTVNAGAVYFSVDVTDDVQLIADASASNYGWLIRADVQDAGTGFRFINNETAAVESRPELIIDYTVIDVPTITGVTGTWRPGESIVISTSLMSTITSVTLEGEALTITGTATDEVTVTVPTDIALLWGGTTYTLVVGDGVDTATYGPDLTLLNRTGWSYIDYSGTAPDPGTTEGFVEYADVYRAFTAAIGDQLQYTDSTGLTVADNWLPTVSPSATVTGTYTIFDVSSGTRLAEAPYTISDTELVSGVQYFDRLGALGYTGTMSQRQYDYLGVLGFTGTMSERVFAHLRDLGYTGATVSEMLKQKATAEGYISVSALMKQTGLIP